MQREDAEAVAEALKARSDGHDGWAAGAFDLQQIWIDGQGDQCSVNVVYRQRGGAWTGFRRSSLAPWVYQDHVLTPGEVADDIYDFVLCEPTETPVHLTADESGVLWWPEHDRPLPTSE